MAKQNLAIRNQFPRARNRPEGLLDTSGHVVAKCEARPYTHLRALQQEIHRAISHGDTPFQTRFARHSYLRSKRAVRWLIGRRPDNNDSDNRFRMIVVSKMLQLPAYCIQLMIP